MNTNNNVYTIIYTTVVCVVVAAILAFVSQSLKGRQEANEKAENISQILTAAQFGEKSSWTDNNTTINFYRENINKALLVNAKGETVRVMDAENAEIYTVSDLKKQNYNVNDAAKADELEIPVYIFKNGVSVLPLYGAGLWGPVWGYVALESDLRTIKGAYFDHSSETPGLGGKIKDDPEFRGAFCGKQINIAAERPFSIAKGAGSRNDGIDAISGATMTSKGVDAALVAWLDAYKPYITAALSVPAPETEVEEAEVAEVETVNE